LLCSHEDDLENASLGGLENFGYEHFMKGYKEPMPVGHLPVTGNVATFISDFIKKLLTRLFKYIFTNRSILNKLRFIRKCSHKEIHS
jgi:hypothetical protein